jgi:hypothetical protein
MDDVLLVALAENVIRHVDEKHGRPAAWLAAIAIVILPMIALLGAGWWLLSQ